MIKNQIVKTMSLITIEINQNQVRIYLKRNFKPINISTNLNQVHTPQAHIVQVLLTPKHTGK